MKTAAEQLPRRGAEAPEAKQDDLRAENRGTVKEAALPRATPSPARAQDQTVPKTAVEPSRGTEAPEAKQDSPRAGGNGAIKETIFSRLTQPKKAPRMPPVRKTGPEQPRPETQDALAQLLRGAEVVKVAQSPQREEDKTPKSGPAVLSRGAEAPGAGKDSPYMESKETPKETIFSRVTRPKKEFDIPSRHDTEALATGQSDNLRAEDRETAKEADSPQPFPPLPHSAPPFSLPTPPIRSVPSPVQTQEAPLPPRPTPPQPPPAPSPAQNTEPEFEQLEIPPVPPEPRKKAQLRTAPPVQEKQIADDDDLEDDLFDSEDETSDLPYDFINIPYDDAERGARNMIRVYRSMGVRQGFCLILALISGYMTLAPAFGLPFFKDFSHADMPYPYLLAIFVIQCLCMALCYDVLTSGAYRLAHFRPTLDSLVFFSSVCALAQAIVMLIDLSLSDYMPYCCVSCVTCFFALSAKRQRVAALRRTYKAMQFVTAPLVVKVGRHALSGTTTVKTHEGAYVEIAPLSSMDMTEKMSCVYAPFAIVLSIVLAVLASFAKGGTWQYFLWVLAAVSAAGTPICMLFSSSGVWSKVVRKLFSSGVALAGPEAITALSKCQSLLLRDSDIFPPESVSITGIKILPHYDVEHVISVTASALVEVGGGLAKALTDYAHQQFIALARAEEVQFYESGGMSARIRGRSVVIGIPAFLLRMGITLPRDLVSKGGMFVALDMQFAGVFYLKYKANVQPEVAFDLLHHAKITPIAAVSDFNVTPALVEDLFDLPAGAVDFLDQKQKQEVLTAEKAPGGRVQAVLSRDSMLSFAEAVVACRRIHKTSRFNIICSLVAALAGMALMYFIAAQGDFSAASVQNVLIYLLLWGIPVWLNNMLGSKF